MKILESSQTLLHVLKRETVPWREMPHRWHGYILDTGEKAFKMSFVTD